MNLLNAWLTPLLVVLLFNFGNLLIRNKIDSFGLTNFSFLVESTQSLLSQVKAQHRMQFATQAEQCKKKIKKIFN